MPSQVEQIVKDFEAAWNAGEQPGVSKFLDLIDENQCDELVARLLPIDIEQRIRVGDSVTANDYAALGPAALDQAQCVLDQLDSQSDDADAATPALSDDAPLPTTTPGNDQSTSKQIGPYKLLQQIGEGGMGTVWMAEQEKPVRRRVALKLIRADVGSKDALARFEAERRALERMDHYNIAKVLDAGTTASGSPYFVMELVKGIPITAYCDKNKLSVPERLELMVSVCKAVQHAHQKGIIHRDLKPSNVLVTLYDGKPVPKVIDFGLAKALGAQANLTDKTMFTQFGQVVGTVQYMSPEQAEMDALDVDTRSDIYSLGVMLYELLTGSTPLDKATLGQNALLKVLEIIRETEPPRPSARLSSSADAIIGISDQRKIAPLKLQQILRGELDWVVMKALEKDRTRRYETASSFADDIQNYLDGDAVEARPPSTGYRLRKTIRKHKAQFISIVAVLILLTTVAVGATVAAIQVTAARNQARKERLTAEVEQERAEQNSRKAQEAVDRYLTLVSATTLLKAPLLESLREELLRAALEYYEGILNESAGDPSAKGELVAACLRVSQIKIDLRRPWIQDFRRGVDLIQQMVNEGTAHSKNLRTLAQGIYSSAGHSTIQFSVDKEGKEQEREVLRRAVTVWEALIDLEPEDTGFQADLAFIHFLFAAVNQSLGNDTAALDSIQESCRLSEQIVNNHTSDARYRATLASYQLQIGKCHDIMGHNAAAEAAYRRSRSLYDEIVSQSSDDPNYQEERATVLNGLGVHLCSRNDDDEEGLALIQESIEAFKKLAIDFPNVGRYEDKLQTARTNLNLANRDRQSPRGPFVEDEPTIQQPADFGDEVDRLSAFRTINDAGELDFSRLSELLRPQLPTAANTQLNTQAQLDAYERITQEPIETGVLQTAPLEIVPDSTQDQTEQ